MTCSPGLLSFNIVDDRLYNPFIISSALISHASVE